MLVVANLSRFVQYVELDLSRFKGMAPVELFSHSPFPQIGDLPYLLTLGPHGFLWFSIEQPRTGVVADLSDYVTPRIQLTSASDGMMRAQTRQALRRILPELSPALPLVPEQGAHHQDRRYRRSGAAFRK